MLDPDSQELVNNMVSAFDQLTIWTKDCRSYSAQRSTDPDLRAAKSPIIRRRAMENNTGNSIC